MASEAERKQFLAYIEANFEDRAPRLAYADWLDEHGEDKEPT